MAVVVRCPGCRGAAQVAPEAIGLLVVCPRCSDPFVAVEEAGLVSPSQKPSATSTSRPPRGRSAEPVSRPRRRTRAEPVAPPHDAAHLGRHDPHDIPDRAHTPGGLPLSVMIGLALLPFVIPMLWVIAPLLFGHQPALTITTPVALAASAAVLCLAVVFTVDWSPMTRLKGVLMLVGLAYFAALSLFFLKKEMVDRAQRRAFDTDKWAEFSPPGNTYRVKVPAERTQPQQAHVEPLRNWGLTYYTATRKSLTGPDVVFVVGAGRDPKGEAAEEIWFEQIRRTIANDTRADLTPGAAVPYQGHPGREWQLTPTGDVHRIVRVYRVEGMVYYLSAEGVNLDPATDDFVHTQFFNSFTVPRLNKQPG